MKKLNSSGFMILDVLVAVGIITILFVPIMETTRIALASSSIVKSQLTEADLRLAMLKSIGNPSCFKNMTEAITGNGSIDTLKYYESAADTTGVALLEKSVGDALFKDSLGIVKMEFNPPPTTLSTNTVAEVIVSFKRSKAIGYVTKNNGVCSDTDTTGCYVSKCSFELDRSDPNDKKCGLLDCSDLSSQSSPAVAQDTDCYKVTGSGDTPNESSLVGCGGTDKISVTETVAFGFEAGKNTTISGTFIGYKAGIKTIGKRNTFIGRQAGESNTDGEKNTFIGHLAGQGNTTGDYNTFIGEYAGESNISGNSNIFIGQRTGTVNISGEQNTFIGRQAGENSTGNSNIFIGHLAGQGSITDPLTGKGNNTGSLNNFIGASAGQSNTTGSRNTFIGASAGQSNTTGSHNTFNGTGAGDSNETGNGNTFIGETAGYQNTSGSDNVFIGYFTGRRHQTDNGNTFIGSHSGEHHTGQNNTFIGKQAGAGESSTPVTSDNSIVIKAGTSERRSPGAGAGAGANIWALNDSPGNNNILIGSFSVKKQKELMSKNSNYVWIHDLIEGNNKEQWVAIKNSLETNNLYASLHTSSDKRLKTNIKELSRPLDKLNKLNAYSFEWNKKSLKQIDKKHIGFIAQEVKKVIPELVTKDRAGFFTIRYTEIIPLIVSALKEFQELVRENFKKLKQSLSTTQDEIKALKRELKKTQLRLKALEKNYIIQKTN